MLVSWLGLVTSTKPLPGEVPRPRTAPHAMATTPSTSGTFCQCPWRTVVNRKPSAFPKTVTQILPAETQLWFCTLTGAVDKWTGCRTIPHCWGGQHWESSGEPVPTSQRAGDDLPVLSEFSHGFSNTDLSVEPFSRHTCRTAAELQTVQSGAPRAFGVAQTRCEQRCMLQLISGRNSHQSWELLHWGVTGWCTRTKIPGDNIFLQRGRNSQLLLSSLSLRGSWWGFIRCTWGKQMMWLDCLCSDGLTDCSRLHVTFGLFSFTHFWVLDCEWCQSTSDGLLTEWKDNKYDSWKKTSLPTKS